MENAEQDISLSHSLVKIANGCWLVVMMFYLGKEHF
jgi:hypothetical protein